MYPCGVFTFVSPLKPNESLADIFFENRFIDKIKNNNEVKLKILPNLEMNTV